MVMRWPGYLGTAGHVGCAGRRTVKVMRPNSSPFAGAVQTAVVAAAAVQVVVDAVDARHSHRFAHSHVVLLLLLLLNVMMLLLLLLLLLMTVVAVMSCVFCFDDSRFSAI
jgi:hypothetical protein